MKETIILSSINERELLRSLALQNVGSFNVRIFNAIGLAKEALIRSGKPFVGENIENLKQACIIYSFIKEIKYFENNTFLDVMNIVKALNYARLLCRGNEQEKFNEVFSDGEFKEKNLAFFEVYKKYQQYKQDNKVFDDVDIINQAIQQANKIDADFIILKETPLEPLEEELLRRVSNNFEEKTIRQLAKKDDQSLSDISYDNCYGSVNEVEFILGYIAKNNIPYEDCTIAMVDLSYLKQFITYHDVCQVPMTFGTGVNLSSSNAYKLLVLLDEWNKNNNSLIALKRLLYAPEFNSANLWDEDTKDQDKAIEIVGNLRLSTSDDGRLDKYLQLNERHNESVKHLADELFKGYAYIIRQYTIVDNENEYKAINKICDWLDILKDISLTDIISLLVDETINKELSTPAALHVTSLQGALSSIRKHLFICGLNAETFPGSPKENYILLDSDLERFEEVKIRTSSKKIQDNKDLLLNVLYNVSACNSKIHLSFSGYGLTTIKQQNPSSMLFEIYKLERQDKAEYKDFEGLIANQHKYFDEDISSLKKIGTNYIEGKLYGENQEIMDDYYISSKLEYPISPSAAEIFFECPKRFYFKYVLGLYEPEDDNVFKPMPANDEGNLIHKCMEDYGNNPNWTKEEYMTNARKIFEEYFIKRIPIIDSAKDQLRDNFFAMVENGYDSNPGNEVIASEIKIGPVVDTNTGLSFKGTVDRVEKLANGHYQIVDYKTYRDFKNKEDDINTCFQVVLYAYLLEKQEGYSIDNCQYRYLRLNENVDCCYDDQIKDALIGKLEKIKDALNNGNFKETSDDNNCRYCKFKDFCSKKEQQDD